MKTTKLLYARFSEHNEDGVSYSLFDEDMRDYLATEGERIFVDTIEFESVDRDKIIGLGVASIDKDIADLQVAINRKQDKKQQLLAIGVDQ